VRWAGGTVRYLISSSVDEVAMGVEIGVIPMILMRSVAPDALSERGHRDGPRSRRLCEAGVHRRRARDVVVMPP